MPITELHRNLQRKLRYRRDWNSFVDDWCGHFNVDEPMLDLVRHLALSNRVILFSNTNREHWTKVRNLTDGAFDRFECYLSYEIGEAKPSLGSFRAVAARAHINPAHSLFIDDRIENVEAARRVGLHAELFVSMTILEEYLAHAQRSNRTGSPPRIRRIDDRRTFAFGFLSFPAPPASIGPAMGKRFLTTSRSLRVSLLRIPTTGMAPFCAGAERDTQ